MVTLNHSFRLIARWRYRNIRLVLTGLVVTVICMAQQLMFLAKTQSTSYSVPDIRWLIQRANEEQKIWNEDRFGPVTSDTLIVLIQVHTRLPYLVHTLNSLQNAIGVHRVLLILSHDVYDNEINTIVQSIQFARVMQIFYPYSMQVYPDSFPGQDPNDCPRDMNKEEALKLKCNNAQHPDAYNHYREAKVTQIKHHWWWKTGYVFGQLRVMRNHSGPVMFLEEDNYVLPDIFHVYPLLRDAQQLHCPQCNLICLGNRTRISNFGNRSNEVEIWPYMAGAHNMAMIMTRPIWEDIVNTCSQTFCTLDEFNWDLTLHYIGENCLKNKLLVLVVRAPRVYHIGACGLDYHSADCSADGTVEKIKKLTNANRHNLFPDKLSFVSNEYHPDMRIPCVGGWADVRDHWFCLHLANETSTNSNVTFHIDSMPKGL